MKLQLVVSNQTNPHMNVSVENYLLGLPETDVITMYLWKNHRTVVVGQNQNPFAECNVSLLESEGGYLMRRRTGGGAVYHDDGNINFSFIVPHALYDQTKQFSVLQKSVAEYGLQTEVSGRNDVLCEGRKFSGNAFSKGKYQNLHHGTILIKGNMKDLQRYLKVKPAKLHKHGVKSVQSRIVNLSELAPVTSENIVPHLISAFEEVYGGKVVERNFDQICQLPEVKKLYEEFISDEWRFGKWRTFQAQYTHQFDWGEVQIDLDVDDEHDIIRSVRIASDGLDLNVITMAENLLKGTSSKNKPQLPQTEGSAMIEDILNMIYL